MPAIWQAPDELNAATARLDIGRLLDTVPRQTRELIQAVKVDGRSIEDVSAASGLSQVSGQGCNSPGVKGISCPHQEVGAAVNGTEKLIDELVAGLVPVRRSHLRDRLVLGIGIGLRSLPSPWL